MIEDQHIEEIVRVARDKANSWTLSRQDAIWVAKEAMQSTNETHYQLWNRLHKVLWDRRQYYPSAREVSAICKVVREVFDKPAK